MTEVAGGQNEANKTFAPEFFVNLSLFVNHFSCGYETYRICIIEDEEHFGEVGLRLTPRLGREMRLTINDQSFALFCKTVTVTIVKLTEYVLSRTGNILVRSN